MKVLQVAAEVFPLLKTGGLADVTGALPLALAPLGVTTKVLMPGYPGVREQLHDVRPVAALPGLFGGAGNLVASIHTAYLVRGNYASRQSLDLAVAALPFGDQRNDRMRRVRIKLCRVRPGEAADIARILDDEIGRAHV